MRARAGDLKGLPNGQAGVKVACENDGPCRLASSGLAFALALLFKSCKSCISRITQKPSSSKMAPAVRAPGHVSLKGIMVRLKLKKGFEEAEIPVDVQQTTALQTRCSISAAPRRAFAVGVELGPEIDSQPDSRAFMVSIAYDARNDASHRTQMRTDSWLLPDVTRSRLFMSHHAIVYDPQHRRTFSYQRNMPGYTATRKWTSASMTNLLTRPAHLPPTSERHSRRLCDMKAHEGGISIYVHCVKRKAPVADRKRIPADEVEELEGKQTLVAEFHFLNTGKSIHPAEEHNS